MNRAYWLKKAKRVLVERAQLDPRTWLRTFKRLVRDIHEIPHLLHNAGGASLPLGWDPREPLIWAYCVLQSMPNSLRQDYRALKESAADRTGIEDGLPELRVGHYRFRGLDKVSDLRLRWLARLVRALDQDIAGLAFIPSGQSGEQWSAASWQVGPYPCYLIPIDRSRRLRDGKPAERRSMRHHALIPTHVGEYQVRLVLHPAVIQELQGPESDGYRCGAAIFEDLRISTVTDDGGFMVDQVQCDDQWERMADHVSQGRRDACHVLMWPELAVPHELAERLGSKLAGEALEPFHKIPIVVAGSWHVPSQGGNRKWANRATVIDGRGNPLFSYDKRMKFDVGGCLEAIEPGRFLPILVTEDRLTAVAICRDFCDDCENYIYQALDVDWVLVPSMGWRTTADAHERQAKPLQSLHDTGAFIVQQPPVRMGSDRPSTEPAGYSFILPKAPDGPSQEQRTDYRCLKSRV